MNISALVTLLNIYGVVGVGVHVFLDYDIK